MLEMVVPLLCPLVPIVYNQHSAVTIKDEKPRNFEPCSAWVPAGLLHHPASELQMGLTCAAEGTQGAAYR